MNQNLRYALITPARNEAACIELTLRSVVQQTLRPVKWVIVSDGSTDGTDDIVGRYAAEHNWIELVRMPERTERSFAGKVCAFNAGYERVRGLTFDIIASLDGDISFDPEYFAFLLGEFAPNPRLGVGGTPFREGNAQYDYRFSNIDHVSGACQVFRRECFEEIGGYLPIKGGGIDLVAVVTARMRGWQTRSFPEKFCHHHKEMGTGMHNGLNLPFEWGQKDYRLGGHPVWQIFRCVYQMKNKPFILGGVLCLAGYCSFAMPAPAASCLPGIHGVRGPGTDVSLEEIPEGPDFLPQAGCRGDVPRMIIINADDWGRSPSETDAALACFKAGRITSVSAMVFMNDSERAAGVARREGIDVGLHLNLNESFASAPHAGHIVEDHERVVRFLKRNKYCQLLYNPSLRKVFPRVFRAQYRRVYPALWPAPLACGWPPTHAFVRQYADWRRHPGWGTGPPKLLVLASGKKPFEPDIPAIRGPPALAAAPYNRLFLCAVPKPGSGSLVAPVATRT